MKKRVSILGSTGSIGLQTIDVAKKLDIEIIGIAAYSNAELLKKQIDEINPQIACIMDKEKYNLLKDYSKKTKIVTGIEGLIEVATIEAADIVLNSVVGIIGLVPTIEAIKNKKTIALANKEALVTGGKIINKLIKDFLTNIIPVDSEHSALFQCLVGEDINNVKRLILTASGGPFRGKKNNEIYNSTVDEVLKHPTWSMGKKITVDSATLINKGFEVIEAMWLFEMNINKIDVIVHPQSIIHSMVEFNDNSIKAQLSNPDMRLPIEYALTYPERQKSVIEQLDFAKVSSLTFERPDIETFKLLKLSYQCAEKGEGYPIVLNGANEVAVQQFLEGKIKFGMIADVIESALNDYQGNKIENIEDILIVDNWARRYVIEKLERWF
ncbi:1-deoxy-D-xylulose-5-phosphate reductoisomerase [Caldicellulosiruptoraceae bacterium PP1]